MHDLYLFGADFDQSPSRVVGLNGKYSYQGKELLADLGLNLYDFHSRAYDPLLGRFHSVDEMAGAYAGLSPFAGMANNPVSYVDPDGRLPILIPILIGVAAGGFSGYQAGKAAGATGLNLSAYTARDTQVMTGPVFQWHRKGVETREMFVIDCPAQAQVSRNSML